MNLLPLRNEAKVAVIGSGVSGLTFAYFLNKLRPDVNITIYEKANRSGGWINSEVVKVGDTPVLLEKGPRTLRGVSNGTLLIVDVLRQLNKENQIEVLPKSSIANRKWLWSRNNDLIAVPNPFTWPVFFSFLKKSGIFKLSLFKGFWRESKVEPNSFDESIESFFKRRFGNTLLTDNVLSAVLHGIYAGDISKLSIKSIFPKLKILENDYGSLSKATKNSIFIKFKPLSRLPKTVTPLPELYSNYKKISETDLLELSFKLKQYPMIKLQDGLQTFTDSILASFKDNDKVKVIFNSDINLVDINAGVVTEKSKPSTYDHVRSTINVNKLSKLVTSPNSEINNIFNRLIYANIFLVNIYSRKSNLIPEGKQGFGFLVPKFGDTIKNQNSLLGIIYDSDVEKEVQKFDGSPPPPIDANYHKITLMMGGWYYKNEIPSQSVLLESIKHVLSKHLGVDQKLILRDEERTVDKQIKDIGDDLLVSFNLHKDCIPQYEVGYEKDKEAIFALLCDTKLSLGGQAFGKGIGVPDCVENAFEAADKLSSPQVDMREVVISEEEAQKEEDDNKREYEKIQRENQAKIEDEKSRYY